MNAGAFGGEVADVLTRVRIVDAAGRTRALRASEIEFSYRRTSIDPGAVVVAATFRCAPGKIRQDVYERSIGRKQTQPIWERSFGSTFVNPPGRYAARRPPLRPDVRVVIDPMRPDAIRGATRE